MHALCIRVYMCTVGFECDCPSVFSLVSTTVRQSRISSLLLSVTAVWREPTLAAQRLNASDLIADHHGIPSSALGQDLD